MSLIDVARIIFFHTLLLDIFDIDLYVIVELFLIIDLHPFNEVVQCVVLTIVDSSIISNIVEFCFSLCFLYFLRTLPIDCRLRILLLDGEAKITLCKFLILIPVLKVP